ncbi:MAG: UvrB/UvrC motif-containing protein, partial [Methylococcales bacterium]
SIVDILQLEIPGGGPRSTKPKKYAVAEPEIRYVAASPKETAKLIRKLEERMYEYARELEFEEAAKLRDEIQRMRNSISA